VIGTVAGGLPEVVTNDETGVLCNVGDIDAMSSAAVDMLRNRDKWERMSRCAAQDARQRYAMNEVVAQYEAFYAQALG